MKQKIILTTICLVSVFLVQANDTKTLKSEISEVTVFHKGAELIHKASGTLTKGTNEIVVSNLSPSIDVNSIKINVTGGGVITNYEFAKNYLTEKLSDEITKKYQDSIKYYEKESKKIDVKLKTNKDLIELLKANKSIAGTQTGLSVTELMKMMDYYKTKSEQLENEQSDLDEKQNFLDERIALLKSQLEEESRKNDKTDGTLKLTLNAPSAATYNFTITYFTPLAQWIPFHNINVEGIEKPIKISTKAKISQTTGLDWNKVKLTLSTASPSGSKVAPLFSTWFLSEKMAKNYRNSDLSNALAGRLAGVVVQNSLSYADKNYFNASPGASSNIRIRGTNSLDASAAPLYVIDGVLADASELSRINPDRVESMEVLKDASATSIYGSRGANGVVVITTKGGNMTDYVTESEEQLNLTFNIDMPYTILGNGKEQNVDLQSKEVVGDFKYYSAPKLAPETFVVAELHDWEKLNLLSGKANVTFEGTYVGETFINVTSTKQALTLTLGTDKRVAVKREMLKDFSSSKSFGSDTEQVFTYQLTVKNNQSKMVKMTLKDQYPLSTRKDIEVKLLTKETTPASHNNEEVGTLTWNFDLNAGESKIFKISYSVRYPKGLKLNL